MSDRAEGQPPGPTELHDARTGAEIKRAAIWIGMALAVVGVIWLAQPIMLIIGGLVFSVMLARGGAVRWFKVTRAAEEALGSDGA